MLISLMCLTLLLASAVLTGLFRRYALASGLLDIPNERSSHQCPTPRGAGLVFVAVFLLFAGLLCAWGYVTGDLFAVMALGGGSLALCGFVDDRVSLAARWRLLTQAIAALVACHFFGGFPAIMPAANGLCLLVLGVLFFIWLTNLYNFMDGINGLAAVEAITACLSAAFLYWLNDDVVLALPPLGLAAVVAGFLYWNFPVARLFMGDSGSGFLGFILACFAWQAGMIRPEWFWSWMIVLAVFIVDATTTLLRRALNGQHLAVAHRDHGYQRAARRLGRHAPVTLAVLSINLIWLLPVALLVGCQAMSPVTGMLLAYVPLWVIYLFSG